jgi:hypothetical protein
MPKFCILVEMQQSQF